MGSEKERQNYKNTFLPLFFPRLNFSPSFSIPHFSQTGSEGWRMVGLWSVHNSSHLLLLLSHILPHSSIGTPWATDLLVLLVSLFQCGSSKGCSSFKEYPVLQCGLLHRLKCGYCSNRHLEHLLPLPLLWPWCSQS